MLDDINPKYADDKWSIGDLDQDLFHYNLVLNKNSKNNQFYSFLPTNMHCGVGSTGHIYYGRNNNTHEVVALKRFVLPIPCRDENTLNVKLHPLTWRARWNCEYNINQFLGIDVQKFHDTDGNFCFIMPFFGKSLFDVLSLGPQKVFQPLEIKEALSLAVEVSFSVLKLHKMGIAHLDLKPENIAVDLTGKVTLIDYGASTNALQGYDSQVKGTDQYMPRGHIDRLRFFDGFNWTNQLLDHFALLRVLLTPSEVMRVNSKGAGLQKLTEKERYAIFTEEQARRLGFHRLINTIGGKINTPHSIEQLLALLLIAMHVQKYNKNYLGFTVEPIIKFVEDNRSDKYIRSLISVYRQERIGMAPGNKDKSRCEQLYNTIRPIEVHFKILNKLELDIPSSLLMTYKKKLYDVGINFLFHSNTNAFRDDVVQTNASFIEQIPCHLKQKITKLNFLWIGMHPLMKPTNQQEINTEKNLQATVENTTQCPFTL